ncbi:MAG: hypothetical protein ACR2OV_04650 [Hyphomicrobiaceae bacterium]
MRFCKIEEHRVYVALPRANTTTAPNSISDSQRSVASYSAGLAGYCVENAPYRALMARNCETRDGPALKRLLYTSAASVLALAVAGSAVLAKDQAPGRYTMHKADDGFVRLDTKTGAMSLCRKVDDNWACRSMPNGDSTTQGEISQLRLENEELRAEVKRLGQMLALKPPRHNDPSDPARPGEKDKSFRLPTEKEVDQALNYFENILRKFQERLKKLERNNDGEPKHL